MCLDGDNLRTSSKWYKKVDEELALSDPLLCNCMLDRCYLIHVAEAGKIHLEVWYSRQKCCLLWFAAMGLFFLMEVELELLAAENLAAVRSAMMSCWCVLARFALCAPATLGSAWIVATGAGCCMVFCHTPWCRC